MSEQSHLYKFNGSDILKSLSQNKNEENTDGNQTNISQKRLKTEK